VARSRFFKTKIPTSTTQSASSKEDSLAALVEAKQYRRAIALLERIKRSEPETVFSPPEAEIWFLKGQEELDTRLFKAADSSFRQALNLGLGGKAYYGVAQALLALDRLDEAIALLKEGFESQKLTSEFNLCYAKLLLIKGDTEAVENLIAHQKKSFKAAEIHWLKGVLALCQQDYGTSLGHLQKVNSPLTPKDNPLIWKVYALQALEKWPEASQLLETDQEQAPPKKFTFRAITVKRHSHAVLQRLALYQCLQTQCPFERDFLADNSLVDELRPAITLVLQLLAGDYLQAGLAYLDLDNHTQRWPEIQTLKNPLLLMAGQQACIHNRPQSALKLWSPLANGRDFNLQLVINTVRLLAEEDAFKERQRLLVRLIKWLEEKGKQEPENFPPDLLSYILAYAHCLAADGLMAMDKFSMALGELQRAERLCAQSPEVLARRGIVEYLEDNYEEAVGLLTEALANGSRLIDAYEYLLKSLLKLDRQDEVAAVRNRFGERFDDHPQEQLDLDSWEMALASLSFPVFSMMLENHEGAAAGPIFACKIFSKHSRGPINSGGKISLTQKAASREWDLHLAKLEPVLRAQTLTAIALCIHLFSKREQGITALLKGYLQQLAHLGEQFPAVQQDYLMLMSLRENNRSILEPLIKTYMDGQPEKISALALLQLRLRFFATPKQQAVLRPYLETAYQKEPQNPLLLLAIATTYNPHSSTYENYQRQSFEIARRLQDAQALRACRQESQLLSLRNKQEVLLRLHNSSSRSGQELQELAEIIAEDFFEGQIHPSEVIAMLMGMTDD
jgi:tetratricopeptide (TPR) repeat protein